MTTQSRLVEPASAPGDLNALEQSLKEATAKKPADASGAKTEQTNKNEPSKPEYIEDKFWTGDLAESARKQAEAYKSLQSAYGRMANDLGVQRKLTDQLLALDKRSTDLDGKPADRKPLKVDPKSLVNDPTKTLDEYWAQREADLKKEFEERERKAALQAAEAAFLAKHSDFDTVTATEKFQKWVHSSPLRRRAAALAGQGNYVVADELLTEYKALEGQGPGQVEDPNRGQDTEAARKASLESSAQAGGSGTAKAGQIYRRQDLIRLKMEKPHVYQDPKFQDEILRAYAEGRVK